MRFRFHFRSQTRSPRLRTWIRSLAIFSLSVVGTWGCLSQFAAAGPITGTSTNPPTKLAVYQGVVSIIPTAGSSVMEIGNLGMEIISTGDINLRPQSLAASDGVRITRDTTTGLAWLRVSGKVCLNSQCRNTWPASGGGQVYWQATAPTLTEVNAGYGLYAPGPSTPGLPAIEVYGSHSDTALLVQNSSAAPTAKAIATNTLFVHGNIDVTGDLVATGKVIFPDANTGESGTVWHPGNDGIGSGLDADKLDGFNIDYDFNAGSAPSCTSPAAWCVCTLVTGASGNSTRRCIRLAP